MTKQAQRPRLMGRTHPAFGYTGDFMHYRDLRVSHGWPAFVFSIRWDLCRMYQKEFAEIFGVSTMTVSRWERGLTPVPLDVVRRLSQVVTELAKNPKTVESNKVMNHCGREAIYRETERAA